MKRIVASLLAGVLLFFGAQAPHAQVPIYTKGPIFNAASVPITGGNITGVTGVPVVLTVGGVPVVGLSSGSVSAGGAISAITALPAVYPSAYCYFPASILATTGPGSTAGLYYCTFTTTTAGTAFLNAYTSGTPTIPTSPTAVTNGQGAFTGDTGEEFALTVTVPALTGKATIRLSSMLQATNNANAKTFNVRLSGNAGTIFLTQPAASQSSVGLTGAIINTGAAAKQISVQYGATNANATFGVLGTVDLSLGTATLVMSLTRAVATDNFVLLPPTIEVLQLL